MANLSIIQERFLKARKIYGNNDEIATPSGTKVRGIYLLTEAGAVTPSHDPLNAFVKSDGFPTDRNGQSVNDRDYERDADAQKITRNIAAFYDSRALQTPVIVSKDGVVLSGNGRTMAGILAARDNTDASYIDYLLQFSTKYGISKDDVLSFGHPRIVFKTDNDYPYTAETFAMFNAQDIKSQSKTEQAVKLGKLVDDETFHRIIRNINQYDTIGEFYNNIKAASEAINDLVRVGVISQMQQPEMFDGETISPQAHEILENVLIGKAFSTNPDAVRQITAFKGIRKNIITALAEISNNIALTDYSLEREMADAIDLVYNAKSSGYSIADYTLQPDAFSGRKAYVTDTTVIMLADLINHEQVTRLKRLFVVYNGQAKDAANGQTDMFSGGIKTKAEILDEAKAIVKYSTKKLNDHLHEVAERRKHEARTAIFLEEAERDSEPSQPVKTEMDIGDYCRLKLPNGDFMVVKYEYLKGSQAGVRLKGWKRILVPVSLLSPTSETALTLPSWWREFKTYTEIVQALSRDESMLAA